MIRHTLRLFAAAMVATFALSAIAEAAPPKTTRHTVRHSTRRTGSHASSTTTK